MQETDYNDFADAWIELNKEVKNMHIYSLKREWDKAEDSAIRAKDLCITLADFFECLS